MEPDSSDPVAPPGAVADEDTSGEFEAAYKQWHKAELGDEGIDAIPGIWSPEDRAWIRDRSLERLESEHPRTQLEARRCVRRVALERDFERLHVELERDGHLLGCQDLVAERDRLRANLWRLSPRARGRLVGVSLLRWVADAGQSRRVVAMMASAIRKVRNTLDASLGLAWAKILEGSSLAAWEVDQTALRSRLLWHLHVPTLAQLEAARPFYEACVLRADSAAAEAHRHSCESRNVHDEWQRIAGDAWADLCFEARRAVVPGSESERALRGWADKHLTAVRFEGPIRECSLWDRVLHANRPDAEGRAALRVLVERALPSLLGALDHLDAAAGSADGARARWHAALDGYQNAIENTSPEYFQARDTFLRSLADACGRAAKG